jgi:hypothetical protein
MVQGGYRGAANCELAGKLGLERYAECFADNRIDVGVLTSPTDYFPVKHMQMTRFNGEKIEPSVRSTMEPSLVTD